MRLLRIVLVLTMVAGLTWLTVGVGMANMLGSVRPASALWFNPFDARVRANIAERGSIALAQRPDLAADIDHLARRALARDPTVVDAWRLMGIVASLRGAEQQSVRTLQFAARLSRRDLPVQLWLIEEQVRRDNVPGALRHYDIALRTSTTSRQLLLPVLAAASAQPNVARPLLQLLASNPPWRGDFATQLTYSTITGDTLPTMVEQLASTPAERQIMLPMVQRLVTAGDYNNAWRVYRLLKQAPAAPPEPVRDGGFAADPLYMPFDWFMINAGALRAERRMRPDAGDDAALHVSAEGGASGEGARQMLLLAPGSYVLTATIGSVAEASVAGVDLQLRCVGDNPLELGRASFTPSQAGGAPQRLRFAVPTGCRAQTLSIGARSTTDVGSSEAWIDNVAISPS